MKRPVPPERNGPDLPRAIRQGTYGTKGWSRVRKFKFFPVFMLAAALLGAQDAPTLEKRRDVIRYGIESELLELVAALQTEKEDALNPELLALLAETRSPRLREAVLKFFAVREWPGAVSAAVGILDARDQEPAQSVNAALGYLSAVKAKDGIPEAREILDSRESKYLSAAVRLLGRAGGNEETALLLGLYDSDDATDALRQDVIQALGEIGAQGAVESLMETLDDTSGKKATRMFSAEALGKIKDARAVPALVRAANGEDPQVRGAAIAALGSFTGTEAEGAIVQGLRDSVPAVRLAAIKAAAALSIREAEPFVRFRARNDPDRKVKDESIKALGALGGRENLQFLRDLLQDKKADAPSRAAAFAVLLERDAGGSRGDLEKVLAAEASSKDTTLLKAFQRALVTGTDKASAPLVETYLLGSPDFGTRIAGIDWARRNKVGSLRPAIAAMAESDKVESVRNRAAAALADL